MIPKGELTGAVLAGGESRRMGRDKAALMIGEIPLWQRQVLLLQSAGAGVVGVVRRPGQPALGLSAQIPLWQDAVAGIGPLAGLHAALAACPTPWLAVVATDMPRIEAAWFQWLGGFCAPGRGAMAQRSDGTFEPLAAIYPQAALTEATQRLAGPDFSLQALAKSLVAQQCLASVPLPDADLWQVENWNTPAEAGQASKPSAFTTAS
jgi:molybdopterin-guanine dinucleotide biosynthesis protein A